MTAPARSNARSGAWRQGARCLLASAALALACAAHAQIAGTLAVASSNRYRGMGTGDVGPVLRASVMVDLPAGAYGGVSGLWRTRDAGLASAEAMVGWSGRVDALPPDWGWDAALQRAHYAAGGDKDFTEAMLGILGPGFTLRTWYAPHYFGGYTHAFYTELNASRAIDERWHAFGHVGWLRYGPAADYQEHMPDRVDTLAGIGLTLSRWELQLARDGIVAGRARSGLDARARRAAWIASASVAF
ncbi:MAG TPA: hypothetical protein VIN75_09335 [Burkholderiaceae bacterium]